MKNYKIIWEEYKCRYKIAKEENMYLVLNHLYEEIDSYESFNDAYDLVIKKSKDCK